MDIQAYIQSGIIESYVLGLANAEEATEVQALQLQYPEVSQAIAEFSRLLENQAFENAVAPPENAKAKILAAIKDEEQSSAIAFPAGNDAGYTTSVKDLQLWRMLAAVCVILFVISTAVNIYLYNRYNQKNDAYQALLTERNTLEANNQIFQTHLRQWQTAAEVMADPAMLIIKMPGTPGKEQHFATVYWNTKSKDVYIIPNKLPQPAKGKQFQLWALVDGKPIDAGVLDPSCEGVCKMKNMPRAQAFAITLENAGGSPTPTMNQLYVLGKI